MKSLRRIPYPTAAAVGIAAGAYLFGNTGCIMILSVAAAGIAISPFRSRWGIVITACSLGMWLSALPGITAAQEYTPFPAESVVQVSGSARMDSRKTASGAYWFVLDADRMSNALGESGTSRIVLRVLSQTDPRVGAGQQVDVTGQLTESGWMRASSVLQKGWSYSLPYLRHRVRSTVRRELRLISPVTAGMAETLLMGSGDDIDPHIRGLFETTGLLHILALSGMHLGILVGLPVSLLKRVIGLRFALLCGIALVLVFIWFIGVRSSLMRAGVFFSIAAVWIGSGRAVRPLVVLSQSFLLLAVCAPFLIHETGFQLSFAAVAGILVFSPPILSLMRNNLPGRAGFLYPPLAAGIGASIGGLPIAASVWGVWYPLGILLTLIAVPVITILMYMCILMLVGYLCMFPGIILAPLEYSVSQIVRLFTAVLGLFSGRLQISLSGPEGTILWTMIMILSVLPVFWWHRTRTHLCEESCTTRN